MFLTAMNLRKNEWGKYALTAMILKNWLGQVCFDCYDFEKLNEVSMLWLLWFLKIEWGNYVLILLKKVKQLTIYKLVFWTVMFFNE